ncbi:hypothetical protein [Spongiimicrobium salis]|uniref:hypothetical protein n=1 Tax=Spongiimicrobium salis TaxID=1667022 RepID=UPI00374D1B0D
MKSKHWIVIIAGISACIVFFAVIGIPFMENSVNSHLTKEEAAEQRNYEDAAFNAQRLIKNKLKTPTTAKFPASFQATVNKNVKGNYEVSSYVDSQNGFGAMVRTNWSAEIRYTESEVQLVDYKFYE